MGTCHSTTKPQEKQPTPVVVEQKPPVRDILTAKKSHKEPKETGPLAGFQEFYSSIHSMWKQLNFSFDEPDSLNTFQSKLCMTYEISEYTANLWTAMYIDYMILLAYLCNEKQEAEFFYKPVAPAPILLTWRLHILYSVKYSQFCNLLTKNRKVLDFVPLKLIDAFECSWSEMKRHYEEQKFQFLNGIYVTTSLNPVGKSHYSKQECLEAWEDFEISFPKYALNCCLVSHKISPIKSAAKSGAVMQPDTQLINFESLQSFRNEMRRSLGLENLASIDNGKIPLIKSCLNLPMTDQKINTVVNEIDIIRFPERFIEYLCMEQMISAKEAIEHILEYKKFLFLLDMNKDSDLKIYPSEKVRQVWFLHMQFTKNYRDEVLVDGSFFYSPYTGDNEERTQPPSFHSETSKLYESYFNKQPEHIWPRRESRFAEFGLWRSNYQTYFQKYAEKRGIVIDQEDDIRDHQRFETFGTINVEIKLQ